MTLAAIILAFFAGFIAGWWRGIQYCVNEYRAGRFGWLK